MKNKKKLDTEDDGSDFLRDQHEDWVASGRKEEAEREAFNREQWNINKEEK